MEEQLARTVAEKQKAEDALEAIREDLVGARSENESTVVILQKNEKERVRLKSLLDEQTRLAEERATTIARLKRELADTEKRLEDSERSLVSHTEAEREKLEATLREQRESQATLQALLDDTRNGMSEAIRRERERAGSERNRVLSEGHARLSEVEADLGKSLRINTDLRSECDRFKQQLADRDLEIERLASEIDDLQIFNLDEKEARSALLIDFEKTKKGLSSALRFARLGIEAARKETSSERARSEALASQLEDSQSSIASMEEAQRRMRKEHEKAVAEWSKRCDRLREKRLKLVEKKSSLKQFRKQIRKAQSDRSLIEEEVSSLRLEKKRLRERNEEFEDLRRTLSTEREDLVEGIRNAREELARTERDRRDSEKRLREHAETIETIEKRIATLRQIETELGHALEKRRKEGVVSRGGVFASLPQSFAESFSFSREEFFRKLTARLDLIDDLSSRYGNRWRHQRIAKQLALLKSSFLDLLLDHSVQEFHLEPGTIVSIEERQRIKLVAPDDHVSKRSSSRASRSGDDRTKILSTIRPGYVFRDGTRDVIIRKAEVVVA